MAEDFIEEIYLKSMHLMQLKLIVEMTRQRCKHNFILGINEMLPVLGELAKEWTKENYEDGVTFWNSLQRFNSMTGDLIAYGDYLEDEIIPQYNKYLRPFCNICVEDENGLCIKSAENAFLTIIDLKYNSFIHSNKDPMWEAYIQATLMYKPEIRDYYILGAGLGYLPYQLYVLSEGTAKIHVYELRGVFAEYGMAYGVLSWIPDGLLEIEVSDSIIPFYTAIEKGQGYYISDYVINYVQENEKNVLQSLVSYEYTKRDFGRRTILNNYINFQLINKSINEFDNSLLDDRYVVVAAGPSLDGKIQYLKEVNGKKTIISVGTVLSKLLKNGISPDAVVVLDPQERTFNQIASCCDENIPMFVANSAHHLFAEKYKGDKYLVVTKAIEDVDQRPNINIPYKTYYCGSTVTTLAVRCAIILGAKEIELIGVDLAYPGKQTHATETMDCSDVNENEMILVDDVKGGKVYTSFVFREYIKELESIIEEHQEIKFYNLSENGANIRGTSDCK